MTSDQVDYQALADFRYTLRRFLRFSEEDARRAGLESQQHQLMLALEGLLRAGSQPDISALSERLQLRHHSVVGLVDRLESRGLVARQRDEKDRRKVVVKLTPEGKALLERLSASHLAELEHLGPALIAALQSVLAVGVERQKPRI